MPISFRLRPSGLFEWQEYDCPGAMQWCNPGDLYFRLRPSGLFEWQEYDCPGAMQWCNPGDL